MSVFLSPLGGAGAQFFDNNGVILTGGKIYTYAAGTSTPQTSYTSSSGATAHANPIVLDSAGRVPGGEIWLTDILVYKFVVETSAAVLLGTYDNISGINAVQINADIVVYDPPFTGGVATTVENKLAQYVSVKDFGAVGDGITDDTAAIQAAFNTNLSVLLPVGEYYVTDMMTMDNGQKLYGEGRTVSNFVIQTDFNLAAEGVIKAGTGEPGAEIYDVGFKFQQADQAVRANVTQYPPAITAPAVPRYIIDRVRIESAWDGIRAIGNSGGAYIGFVEIGALNRGLEIDGSLDFVHGQTWHFWPFGMAGTTNLINVYYDGDTIATRVGRCDGFAVDELSSFSGQVVFTANMEDAIPALINTLQLDNDGARLLVQGGRVLVGKSYSTKTNAVTDPTVHVVNDAVCILNSHTISSDSNGYELFAEDGKLAVNGGNFIFVNLTAQLCRVNLGQLTLNNIYFNAAPNVAYTQPHVVQAGGQLSVNNCEWSLCGTGTGFAVFYTSDQTGNRTANNNFGGWQYSYPTGSNANGVYAPNNRAANPMIFNNLGAPVKYRYLTGTSSGAGAFSAAHGVTNAQLKVLSVSAWYKGASGEAIPAVISAIDGTTVFITGAGVSAKVRVVINWTNYDDVAW
ncbi:glycosyl hydrolase family 28-related protein [Sphingorhabdus sp.]|uniref:glycosyl hydrolase family 28-related protein n=1 Tax=Sphingorhabdus sp. TaxID=1902408 RepID=UPI0033415296